MTETARPAHDAQAFMRRALELAREGWGQTAPNPMVGAVVVRDGHVVAEGFHARFGSDHAEVVALRRAGEQARGATLYVTLEPCRHYGKMPPCTDAILESGVAKVVYAAPDPTPVAGGGSAILKASLLEVESGLMEREARELNAPFYNAATNELPWTTLKLAVSADFMIANTQGSTTWLTSEASRAAVHQMRANSDAIAVGVGTILADDPQLNVREAPKPRKPPARVVFDRNLRTPLNAKVVFTARDMPTIVITTPGLDSPKANALREAGVHVMPAEDLRDAFRRLRSAGIQSLLVEGGATIASEVVKEGLVHRLAIFQAPMTLGPSALPAFGASTQGFVDRMDLMRVVERREIGPDVLTIYALVEG
ncbi:MAG TPA: bifunctional diaminohydroxyphosphoribosylaminopyrimidine deaminase/5-amino-6-(5-phosphoribosylamino)uracil reductase RibD [Gemmatimonadaceae bacterium]